MKRANSFNILQITDIHFREKVDGTIYGVATQPLFEHVWAQIQSEIAAPNQGIDLLLITGDISQDGSAESYRRFHQFIEQLKVPAYFLQGNHDYNAPMVVEFGQSKVAPCVVVAGDMALSPWKVVLLNSSVEDQVGGRFGKAQLEFLQQCLREDSISPMLLCFHHHPMPIDCEWLDKQIIDNAQSLFSILDQFDNVKLCIYGHVHQDRKTIRNNVPYFATPSTCAQFKPEMANFALDEKSPGYRWIRCYDDGAFETEVIRLKN